MMSDTETNETINFKNVDRLLAYSLNHTLLKDTPNHHIKVTNVNLETTP